MSESLVDRIRAALDEDERVARGAAGLCGCHESKPIWWFDDLDGFERILIEGDPHPGVRRQLTRRWGRSYEDLRHAAHIARHDPARVLRQVAAMRKVLEVIESDLADDGTDETARYLLAALAEALGIEADTPEQLT